VLRGESRRNGLGTANTQPDWVVNSVADLLTCGAWLALLHNHKPSAAYSGL